MIYEKRDLFGGIERATVNENTGKISRLKFEPILVKIESFTQKGIFYEIDKANFTCTCMAFQTRPKKMCKHLQKVLGVGEEREKGFSSSLLKSAVQKAIRRGDVDRAVKCAKIHLNKNCNDFWRRLSVIVIEDVVLHPEYRRIVELASLTTKKSYVRNSEDDNFGLKIVEQLARCEWRDFEFEEYFQNRRQDKFGELAVSEKYITLSEDDKALVNAMRWRGKMGGMEGDMKMLDLMSKIWIYRFAEKECSAEDLKKLFPEVSTDYDKVSTNERADDILLSAVDFHISPIVNIIMKKDWVREMVSNEFDTTDEGEIKHYIKDIIWRMRSAVSFKKCLLNGKVYDWLGSGDEKFYKIKNKEKYIKIYSKIQGQLDGISKWYIEKIALKQD